MLILYFLKFPPVCIKFRNFWCRAYWRAILNRGRLLFKIKRASHVKTHMIKLVITRICILYTLLLHIITPYGRYTPYFHWVWNDKAKFEVLYFLEESQSVKKVMFPLIHLPWLVFNKQNLKSSITLAMQKVPLTFNVLFFIYVNFYFYFYLNSSQ